jgi:hypothetical protein
MRHHMLDGSILDKFGEKNVSYTAFVSTSTSHSETNEDPVDGVTVCSSLIERGFHSCSADILPYNPQVFSKMTEDFEFQSSNGVFPFRTASLLSTMSRSITQVLKFEEDSNSVFDAVMITRLDVINGISILPPGAISWWSRALAQFDIVGQKKSPGLIDDRFFFGRRDTMVHFKGIIAAFKTLFSKSVNSPERTLFAFATQIFPTPRIGPIFSFISFDSFVVNDEKYSLSFRRGIEAQLGRAPNPPVLTSEQIRKPCSHIKTPHAHNICISSLVGG